MGKESKRDLCSEFARILDGDASFMNGVCLVQRFRDIPFKILGRRTNSPLVNPQFFTFENLDSKGNALNLGETVLLQVEVNPLLTELRERDIIVTAITGCLKILEPCICILNQSNHHWNLLEKFGKHSKF